MRLPPGPSGQLAPEPRGTASDADLQADSPAATRTTSTPASGSNGKTENMLMQMMQMMHALKEDVDNLKAERPHKKVEASSVSEMTESSTGSFVPIPQ